MSRFVVIFVAREWLGKDIRIPLFCSILLDIVLEISVK